MKRVYICVLIMMLSVGYASFAKGAQAAPAAPVNGTWTLCITEFDTSELPPARAVMGHMVMQYIVENMRTAETRLWTSEEAIYYNKAARLKAESTAAKKITAKQAERDKLIFEGASNRKYKQNLKKIDADLATLRSGLAKANASAPPLALSPAVKLVEKNLTNSFPAPPAKHHEYYFCSEQKADAFLSGKINEYFGRLYIEISLWSVYARRITYTDSIIFSPENIKEGTTELSYRLFDYISGFLPSWIKVRTNLPGAIIIVENNVSGNGETEIMNFTPGTVSVTAFAPDYNTFETKVELQEGELADVTVDLTPIPIDEFEVILKEDTSGISAGSASLYDGALYAGHLPMTLHGHSGQQRNLNVETSDGKIAQTVFLVSKTPIVFDPKTPPSGDRVEVARKKFYSAYGRFWIALPLAVLGMGLNNTITSVYNANPSANPDLGPQQKLINISSIGLTVLTGVFLAESFYRIGRYVWEANKESSPLIGKSPEPDAESADEKVSDVPAGTAGTTETPPGTAESGADEIPDTPQPETN
jgi:hypothetical protein